MSAQPIRYRTFIEVAVIAVVIYFLLGTPGLSNTGLSWSQEATVQRVPLAKAKIESLVYPSASLKCPRHEYETHIFSADPLVVYIDGFLSDAEVEHLVSISEHKWQVSTVFSDGVETTDESVRKSEKAMIERDHTVQCIEQRALAVQGWPRETFIERLWTQRYNISGHYALHYDWGSAARNARRVSTFMVYLKADCTGGGTNFPLLTAPPARDWCEYIECDDAAPTDGVTFKARKGSAVFWMNFDAEGRGYKETVHAGMPVLSGQKIGLNIWSWYQAGHTAPVDL